MIFNNIQEYLHSKLSAYLDHHQINDGEYDVFLYDYNMNIFKKQLTFFGYLNNP